MSRLARDGTAEPVSRDQILRRERGQTGEKICFHVQLTTRKDWQPYPVDPYSAESTDQTYTYTQKYFRNRDIALLHGSMYVVNPHTSYSTRYVIGLRLELLVV